MRRYHVERHITDRNWRNHIRSHQQSNLARGVSPDKIDCLCDQQRGRFRKRDAHDCGKTRCFVCHCDKILDYKTRQDLRSRDKFKAGLSEVRREL